MSEHDEGNVDFPSLSAVVSTAYSSRLFNNISDLSRHIESASLTWEHKPMEEPSLLGGPPAFSPAEGLDSELAALAGEMQVRVMLGDGACIQDMSFFVCRLGKHEDSEPLGAWTLGLH